MKPRDVRKYLFDIAEACQLLEQFTAGKTFADYEDDPLLRSGVERQFEIIGEALRLALNVEPGLAERIGGAGRIIAFRNRLAHGYDTVSNKVVWGVFEANVPALKSDVDALLAEEAR